MATKRYNQQRFAATVNGNEYEFMAWTTSTRCGFCHTVEIWCGYRTIGTRTKCSYYNRTWERFDYETALKSAIKKCPKADQPKLYEIIIERKAQDEHERSEKFLKSFEAMHNSLTDENKKRLAETVGEIRTEGDAQAAMMLGTLMAVMQ